ncbi:hypothetical protein QCA50_003112 [Cerrena zonata]|uniref:Uncharacterized protein n=1 Tax=Cerrena zonata TaxID=2478898 RepID=A0AAW0GT99_9APHY
MAFFPRDEGYTISLWLSTLLFGMHAVLFFVFLTTYIPACCRRDVHRRPVNFYLIFTAFALFVNGAVSNFVGLQRTVHGIWGQTEMSPADWFNKTDVTSGYIESTSWFLQVVLGDSFLSYRCWVIYGKRRWLLLISGLCVLATFCMGVMLQWEFSRPHADAVNLERTSDLYRWEAPMILISVILNVSLTSAIAWKIWWQYRQLGRAAQRREARYLHIMWLIVESGMVVAVAQLLVLVLGAIHNSGYQIVDHAVPPLIGIAFTGIILRVQKISSEDSFYTTSSDRPPLSTVVIGATSDGDDSSSRNQYLSLDRKSRQPQGEFRPMSLSDSSRSRDTQQGHELTILH